MNGIIRNKERLHRFNHAQRFIYEIKNKKRIGRSYYITSILCGKKGRLCSSINSPAKEFIIGRNNRYISPSFKRVLENFDFYHTFSAHKKFSFNTK